MATYVLVGDGRGQRWREYTFLQDIKSIAPSDGLGTHLMCFNEREDCR